MVEASAPAKWYVGDRVIVDPHLRGSTERVGRVRQVIWHTRRAAHLYLLQCGSRKLKKWYLEDELRPIRVSAAAIAQWRLLRARGYSRDEALERMKGFGFGLANTLSSVKEAEGMSWDEANLFFERRGDWREFDAEPHCPQLARPREFKIIYEE